jgi:hypothetical protein
MTALRKVLAVSALTAAACAGCGSNIDAQSDRALRSMSSALDKANALSFHAVGVMDEVARTGQLVQLSRDSKVLLRRPDGLRVETTGDDVSRAAWYDGRTLTVLDRDTKQYATIGARPTIVQTHDFIVDEYGLTMPLADFLCGKTYECMKAAVQAGTYVGLADIEGHSCHHLAFRQEMIDWQIWIDAGQTPVPRKLVITYKLEEGQPSYVATMDQWDLSPRVSDDLFQPALPAGARRVQMRGLLGLEEGE